jgi:hypothetical protein
MVWSLGPREWTHRWTARDRTNTPFAPTRSLIDSAMSRTRNS